jgi:hypothetical protein
MTAASTCNGAGNVIFLQVAGFCAVAEELGMTVYMSWQPPDTPFESHCDRSERGDVRDGGGRRTMHI